jgi:hypothetical protein
MPGSSGISRVPQPASPTTQLRQELQEARTAFFVAVAGLTPTQTGPQPLVGDWGLREIVAHLGYWVGHSVEAIHLVEQDRADEIEECTDEVVEERNATVARVARETDLATVRRREEASFEAVTLRLARLDPSLLDVRLPSGDTLAAQIRIDGSEHYREHAIDIWRAAAGSSSS